MSQIFNNLLAMDRLASQFGCALNPKLRTAMEAETRFPARASAPLPKPEDLSGHLPENVVRLADHCNTKGRQRA